MIDRWYCVSCDGCHGAAEILETPSMAWQSAERAGWTRELLRPDATRPHGGWHGWVHHCPTCSAKRVAP